MADFGRADILVNNAGITKDNLLMRMSSEDWDAVLDTNLKGAFNFIRALLRTLNSLSRREADLATAVANGATPQDYAKKAGLEISTVRSQLKSVFQKTGTHRQTELVRLLSVLPRVSLG